MVRKCPSLCGQQPLNIFELKFVPLAERAVEALHRDVRVASKHIKLGPSKVSLSVRLRETMGKIETGPTFLQSLQACFDITRHLRQAAASLGILGHPVLARLLEQFSLVVMCSKSCASM